MVFKVLQQATAEGKVPGAVGAIVTPEGMVDCRAFGYRALEPERLPMERDTLFDLASLTKMLATNTSVSILLERDKIDLDAPVSKYLPAYDTEDKKGILVRHLVTHTAGFPAWKPLFRKHQGRRQFLKAIVETPLESQPGNRHRYSDFGFISLGFIVERVSGQSLDEFAAANIYEPLGMVETGFRPKPNRWRDCAATERDMWRGRIMWGEVHDENAYALGGVAGHAGLFSTADDLARYCTMILQDGQLDGIKILSPETIKKFGEPMIDRKNNQALGWRLRAAEDSSAGDLFSAESFGHTGFTGTSIWFDPERKIASILLTNRVHPSRENKAIHGLRRAFNDAVIRAYEGR